MNPTTLFNKLSNTTKYKKLWKMDTTFALRAINDMIDYTLINVSKEQYKELKLTLILMFEEELEKVFYEGIATNLSEKEVNVFRLSETVWALRYLRKELQYDIR